MLKQLSIRLRIAAWLGLWVGLTPAHGAVELLNDASRLAINGSASFLDDGVRLTDALTTQAGSVWAKEKMDITQGFDTGFDFQLSTGGADGFAFVVQNDSEAALGGTGGDLGYDGILNSVAIEFDTYMNPPPIKDPNSNHVAVLTNGILPNHTAHTYQVGDALTVLPFALADGQVHHARIQYASGMLTITVGSGASVAELSVPIQIEQRLSLVNGTAWVGFTGATGGLFQAQDIHSWTWNLASPH
jgi:hypothetical protein